MERGGVIATVEVASAPEAVRESTSPTLLSSVSKPDVIALTSLLVIATAAVMLRAVYDNWLSEADLFTFFVPWFGYIGDRLAAGELPVWSNNYLGGIPVIGSPSSGWLYLPVMIFFPLFNVVTAFKLMILTQVLIGGIATYALARRVALQPVAAFAAAAAFALGPIIYESTRFTLVGSQVTTWIPVALLAADLALSTRHMAPLCGWSAVVGLAMSQMIVAWPGQGILYGAMWVGAWMAYRTFLSPSDRVSSTTFRVAWAIASGLLMSIVAFGLSAAALLPVLNISDQSSIPGGDYSQVLGGNYASVPHPFKILLYYLFADNYNIRAEGFGAAAITLSLFGVLLARRRYGAAFFATVLLVGLSLSVEHSPTRPLFELIPGFSHFHGHRPIAIIWTLSLAPAMLVGAGVQSYIDRKLRPVPHIAILGILLLLSLVVTQINTIGSWIGWTTYLSILAVVGIFSLASMQDWVGRFISAERLHRVGLILLLLIIVMFPTGRDVIRTIASPETPAGAETQFLGNDDTTSEVIDTVLQRQDPGTAAEFLQQQQALQQPFRFTSYSGQGYPDATYTWVYNTYWFRRMEPGVVGLLVNARTLRLDLQQTSGYNPVQLRLYVDYINAMNGAQQDYHWSDTFASALKDPDSQLLNMLNVRYILVDLTIPANRPDHAAIQKNFKQVYYDDSVIVYENPNAFPRAWLAHDVFPDPGGLSLAILDSGQVDGHHVAYVNGPVPDYLASSVDEPVGEVPGESVTVTDLQQESMTLDVNAVQDGLVVVSATYADGWNAYVDGQKVDVLQTDHALQGVPVRAGKHQVELRYEPQALKVGLYATGGTLAAVLAIWLWAAIDFFRRQRSHIDVTPQPGAGISGLTPHEASQT